LNVNQTSRAKPLQNRNALITGPTRGIGRAVALELARNGAHIIALARVTGALEELYDEIRDAGGTSTLINLDLENANDIDALGPSLLQRWDHLDIFIANAGILGPLTPLSHLKSEDWDQVMAINLSANWRLIRTLDPLLQRSDAARVIFVSSSASTGKYAYWGPYAISKAGLETLARTYANEVETTTMRVNIINPGPIATGMRAQAFPGEDPKTLTQPEAIAPLFLELSSPSCQTNGKLYNAKEWLQTRDKA